MALIETDLGSVVGPQGPAGPKGATGATGAQGPAGPKGADGTTPTIGSNGNWYLGSTDTGKPSRGATGATGATGPQGAKGATGATGPQGPQGPAGKVDATVPVSFTDASSRLNLTTGETIGTLVGKISKWLKDTKYLAFSRVIDLASKVTPASTDALLLEESSGTGKKMLFSDFLTYLQNEVKPKTTAANVDFTKADGTKSNVQDTVTALNSALGGFQILTGRVDITPKANTPTAKAVKFSREFASAPVVITCPASSVPGTTITGTSASDVTKSGCNIYLTRSGTATSTVMWVAIGPAK